MSKKILILEGSARKKGNSAILAEEFMRGAKENGHEVEEIFLIDKQINDCKGCNECQMNGGTCIHKDDMVEINHKIMEADIVVFASPVYFYTWNATTKRAIDRTYAIESKVTNKTFYLISAGAAPEESYMENMIQSFKLYVDCFRAGGNSIGGYVFGLGTSKAGDVKGTAAMKKAYEMGKNA